MMMWCPRLIRFRITVRQTKVNIGRLVCDSTPAASTKVLQPSLMVPAITPKNTIPSATCGRKVASGTPNRLAFSRPMPTTIRPMESVIQNGPRIEPR